MKDGYGWDIGWTCDSDNRDVLTVDDVMVLLNI